MGECMTCSWYEDGLCKNPDADYMQPVTDDDGCTLWDKDELGNE